MVDILMELGAFYTTLVLGWNWIAEDIWGRIQFMLSFVLEIS